MICPANAQKPFMICCCCGCSCMFLQNLKKFDNPAQYVNFNYYVEIDENLCSGCGDCIARCHMNANKINENGVAEVDLGYCLGCGVCILSCPNEARNLVQKPEESIPPTDFVDLYQNISQNKKILQEKRKIDENYNKVKKVR